MSSLHIMGLTKACNGPRFGIVMESCNIMKPKRGMETAEDLIILYGNNLQKNGSRVIMKYRSLLATNGNPRGLLL